MVKTKNQIILPDLVVVTGPTASGKTSFAAHLARKIDGEIISADSRQVYQGMDLGTGKDYVDYEIDNQVIPHHLIDILTPGTPYNVYAFQQDFISTFTAIRGRNKVPVLCGGTGLYIEAVLKGYRLIEVPPDEDFRESVKSRSDEELIQELNSLQKLHNTTDTDNRKRLIRALEIARYYQDHPQKESEYPSFSAKIIGIKYDRETERRRITQRLEQRLKEGMVEEVQRLSKVYGFERMEYFGLEYKFISWYLQKKISYDEMFAKLNTAIHQFAKRQMTWFRRMEKQGTEICWITGELPLEEKLIKGLNYLTANQ